MSPVVPSLADEQIWQPYDTLVWVLGLREGVAGPRIAQGGGQGY